MWVLYFQSYQQIPIVNYIANAKTLVYIILMRRKDKNVNKKCTANVLKILFFFLLKNIYKFI